MVFHGSFVNHDRLRPKPPRISIFEPTKVPERTSKLCPHCLKEGGRKTNRKREYKIVGPLYRSQCEKGLPERGPRTDYGKLPWNLKPLKWLFAPPSPPTEYGWFEIYAHASCEYHVRELVHELSGIRQFGRFRRLLIWFRAKVVHTLDWVIPIQ